MNLHEVNNRKFLSGGNIAFVIVVLASYASTTAALIYSRRPIAVWEIVVLVAAASAYLIVGTYGFSICRRSQSKLAAAIYFVIQLSLAALIGGTERPIVASALDDCGLCVDLFHARHAFDSA